MCIVSSVRIGADMLMITEKKLLFEATQSETTTITIEKFGLEREKR